MNAFGDLLTAYPAYLIGAAAIFSRLTGLFLGAPFFNHSAIPSRVRGTFIAYLTIAFAFALGLPTGEPKSTAFGWAAYLIPEFILGLAMGVVARIFVSLAGGMGQMVSYSMGLGFATFVDPATGVDTTVIGRLIQTAALLLFVLVDAHLLLIEALVKTFHIIPVGELTIAKAAQIDISQAGADFFAISLRLAAPAMAVGLMIYTVLGVITRVSPQMNVFAFGFALTIPSGLIVLFAETPMILSVFQNYFLDLPNMFLEIVKTGVLK